MQSITRRTLLAIAAASGLGAGYARAQTPVASPMPGGRTHCGINYDVGSELARGEFTRPAEHERFYKDEITAIRDQLHATSVGIFGSRPEQLIPAMTTAAELDLDIRVQTRLNFIDPPEMVQRLSDVAIEAERLRSNGARIVLDVGCEYMLFAEGIIEGDDFFDKLEVIESERVDWQQVFVALFGTLHNLAAEARKAFTGTLTYSDSPMDAELWEPFDIICLDHYLGAESESTYIQTIDDLAATGKPVWISEFGATASSGAPQDAGMSWDVIDYEADPIQIVDGVERDEATQSANILETLDLISQSNAERAYLYEFITPDAPRFEDPRFDWDLTAYSIVSAWGEEHSQPYETTGYWEPKEAFHTIADWNSQ